jgi:hypothetical protein
VPRSAQGGPPKLLGDEPEKAVAWQQRQKHAWLAGIGEGRIDPEDEDMEHAALLALPDGMGGHLWHPATLDNILDLPYVTLHLYLAYRSGMGVRSDPWQWWTVNRVDHQFRVTFEGPPDSRSRCGLADPDVSHDKPMKRCPACEREARGESAASGSMED